jgi:hypothetical protein
MSLLYDPRRASISGSRPALSAAERAFRQVWGAVSHYCAPEVLNFCRAERLDFILGVATNRAHRRLHR